jgi:RNA polymerase sigma factor (sigma-70 family)
VPILIADNFLSDFVFWRVFTGELQMTDSQNLLAEYVADGSEAAFRELVTRHLNLVYSTATRLVDGNSELAKDVAQIVFLDLARLAPTLSRDTQLGGWLHRHTCFVASHALRGERRRQARERQVVALNAVADHSESNLAQLAPILDESINQLGDSDRTAILLRFFEQEDMRSIGAVLGTSEDAAQKRITRALEKLRVLLEQRGVKVLGPALGAGLSSEAVTAAPAGFAVKVSGTALAGATSGGATYAIFKIMSLPKVALLCALVVACLSLPLLIQHRSHASLRAENRALHQQAGEQAGEIASLVAANQRLIASLADATNSQSLNQSQLTDLLRLRNEVGQLRRQSRENAAVSPTVPPIDLENVDLKVLLAMYAEITGRTVLRPALPQLLFTIKASPTNQVEAALILEKALAEKGIVAIPDGDKFVMVVPHDQLAYALPHSAEIKSSPPRFPGLDGPTPVLPSGQINFPSVQIGDFLNWYAEMAGRKLIGDKPVHSSGRITFRSQTPLTKAEAIYAFDTLLAWNGLRVIAVDDDSIKAEPTQ